MAEPDLGDARGGGRGDGAVRGEQEASVDEEPAPAFASSSTTSSSAAAVREGYGGYGGALCGEEAGLDPLQLGPAGAEAPPRAFAQDPHPAPLAYPPATAAAAAATPASGGGGTRTATPRGSGGLVSLSCC